MIWAVAAAGFAGAVVRYVIDVVAHRRTASDFPVGTFVINVTGSFLVGIVVGLVLYHGVSSDLRVVVGTGFLGSYTTFSGYALQSFELIEGGASRSAAMNLVGSVGAGLVAAAAGLGIAGVL